jgi:hypothetical protein
MRREYISSTCTESWQDALPLLRMCWPTRVHMRTQKYGRIDQHTHMVDQDIPGTEGRHACTWVGGVFTPLEDCFISKFSLHLKLVQGNLLRFRLILAEWDANATPTGGGRPGKEIYASQPMELSRERSEGEQEQDGRDEYRCFTLQLPEDGSVGGVRKGSMLLLAASTEGLSADDTAEAAVGCVHKLVVGAVLHSLVWLHGRMSGGGNVQFESAEHTIAGCIHMMSIARVLRGGPALPSKDRASPRVITQESAQEPQQVGNQQQKHEETEQANEGGEARPDSANAEAESGPADDGVGGWTDEQLEDLPLLLWQDDERGLVGVASDVLGAGPEDLENIRSALPPRCAMYDWELLYSTRRSGLSMNTFFRHVTGKKDCVLLIRDDQGHTVRRFSRQSCSRPHQWRRGHLFLVCLACRLWVLRNARTCLG